MTPVGRVKDRSDRLGRRLGPADREATLEAFVELRLAGSVELRNALVEAHHELVEFHVRHYTRRGVADDDLRQVASLALIHAVDRFDPEVGVAFSTFAGRTIDGEVKRWFRDRTWSVRPPRRSQELHLELRRATEDLTQELGRAPRIAELAARVGVSADLVIEASEAGQAHSAVSIDAPTVSHDDDAPDMGDRILGEDESGYDTVDDAAVVADLLAGLDEREREILRLRYFERLSQDEIAERVGVSQSYLSRVLRKTLQRLREDNAGDPRLGPDHDAGPGVGRSAHLDGGSDEAADDGGP